MRKPCIIIVLLFLQFGFSQGELPVPDSEIDSLYREDQFYFGVTYNLLRKMPNGVSQNGFSSGFHLGFIRDMPINKKRNLAFGLGLGYSANSFNQNILISKKEGNQYEYTIIGSSEFSRNKFSQHLIEIPLEFRWRLSTPSEHRFFRLHAGFKAGYVIANTSKFVGTPENEKYSGIDDFNDFQYAFTFSLGYNSWNFYLSYTLNPIFDAEAKIDQEEIEMRAVKLGLIFYIL